jgi:hypothetical protein
MTFLLDFVVSRVKYCFTPRAVNIPFKAETKRKTLCRFPQLLLKLSPNSTLSLSMSAKYIVLFFAQLSALTIIKNLIISQTLSIGVERFFRFFPLQKFSSSFPICDAYNFYLRFSLASRWRCCLLKKGEGKSGVEV